MAEEEADLAERFVKTNREKQSEAQSNELSEKLETFYQEYGKKEDASQQQIDQVVQEIMAKA